MKTETAKLITDAAEVMGIEVEVRDDYSGRGMHGEATVALVFENQTDLLKVTAYAAFEIGRDGEDADEFIGDLDFRYDAMGRSSIVVY